MSLKAVFAGVPTMDCRMQVLMSVCVSTSSVIRGMVFTRREKHCHLQVESRTQFQGYGGDEGRGGHVRVAYKDMINTFDGRQRHSHDPG